MKNYRKEWEEMKEYERNEFLGNFGGPGCGKCIFWSKEFDQWKGGDKGCIKKDRSPDTRLYDNGCKYKTIHRRI